MFDSSPLIKRIATGKLVGFLFGILGFFIIPYLWPDEPLMFRVAVLFWYITFGAVVAIFGILPEIPLLKVKMPWWFISAYVGAWLNFILMLFIYDHLESMFAVFPGEGSFLSCPWWVVVEGAVMGLIVGLFTQDPSQELPAEEA